MWRQPFTLSITCVTFAIAADVTRAVPAAMISSLFFIPSHTPTPTPIPACTPGFWKNHQSDWPDPYDPTDPLVGLFSGVSGYPSLSNDTLLQAVNYGGGGGTLGAAKTLLRAAVPAVLNATLGGYDGTSYDTVAEIQAAVNTALAGSRSQMLALASTLDGYNNLFTGCHDV